MKKHLIRFLNRKSDFTENENLRILNEQYFYVLSELKKLLNHVIAENIKYFIRYKKMYLIKLLGIGMLTTCIIISVILGWIHIYNNANPTEKKKKFVPTFYISDTDTLSQQYAKSIGCNYNIIFLPDPRKDWKKFKEAIHTIETGAFSDSASYFQTNGQRWGRYQLGTNEREIAGLNKNITWKDFSTNPDLQEGIFLKWIKVTKASMQSDINKYSGRYMCGFQITESGIIAMAHNCGVSGARVFLNSNGKKFPIAGEPIKFGKLGGYNLQLE